MKLFHIFQTMCSHTQVYYEISAYGLTIRLKSQAENKISRVEWNLTNNCCKNMPIKLVLIFKKIEGAKLRNASNLRNANIIFLSVSMHDDLSKSQRLCLMRIFFPHTLKLTKNNFCFIRF